MDIQPDWSAALDAGEAVWVERLVDASPDSTAAVSRRAHARLSWLDSRATFRSDVDELDDARAEAERVEDRWEVARPVRSTLVVSHSNPRWNAPQRGVFFAPLAALSLPFRPLSVDWSASSDVVVGGESGKLLVLSGAGVSDILDGGDDGDVVESSPSSASSSAASPSSASSRVLEFEGVAGSAGAPRDHEGSSSSSSSFSSSTASSSSSSSSSPKAPHVGRGLVAETGARSLASLGEGASVTMLDGHVLDVNVARFFPSGKVVLSASGDMSLRVWDARTGHCAARLLGHRAGVLGADFVGRGRTLVSAGRDSTVRLWDVSRAAASVVWALDAAVRDVVVVNQDAESAEGGIAGAGVAGGEAGSARSTLERSGGGGGGGGGGGAGDDPGPLIAAALDTDHFLPSFARGFGDRGDDGVRGGVVLLDARTDRPAGRLRLPRDEGARASAPHGACTRLAVQASTGTCTLSSGWHVAGGFADGTVVVWDWRVHSVGGDAEPIWSFTSLADRATAVTGLAFADGRVVASLSDGHVLEVPLAPSATGSAAEVAAQWCGPAFDAVRGIQVRASRAISVANDGAIRWYRRRPLA